MKSNFSVSSKANLTEFCERVMVFLIPPKELELRSHVRKFELYIYLGNTVSPIKHPYLLYPLIPKINIKSLQSPVKLFLEIGNKGRRG